MHFALQPDLRLILHFDVQKNRNASVVARNQLVKSCQTPTDGGITWVFTYANEKKIRSIQERDKNNPPYDTRKKRRR